MQEDKKAEIILNNTEAGSVSLMKEITETKAGGRGGGEGIAGGGGGGRRTALLVWKQQATSVAMWQPIWSWLDWAGTVTQPLKHKRVGSPTSRMERQQADSSLLSDVMLQMIHPDPRNLKTC